MLVVTPTLGVSAWLKDTVESVARLPLACTHVLMAPRSIVSQLETRFPRIRVVAEPGGGMYSAINAGLAAVENWDAFTYLNDDDILLPNFLAVIRTIAASCDRPLIVYGKVQLIDARGRRIGSIPVSPAASLNRALYAQRLEPVYQHGTLVTRAALAALGRFDQTLRFCGDSEFLARACVKGVPFLRVSGPAVAAFRLRSGQLTKNRPAMIAERARVDEKLGLLVPRLTLRHYWARWRFRTANLPTYAERIARHGFLTFDQLLERGG